MVAAALALHLAAAGPGPAPGSFEDQLLRANAASAAVSGHLRGVAYAAMTALTAAWIDAAWSARQCGIIQWPGDHCRPVTPRWLSRTELALGGLAAAMFVALPPLLSASDVHTADRRVPFWRAYGRAMLWHGTAIAVLALTPKLQRDPGALLFTIPFGVGAELYAFRAAADVERAAPAASVLARPVVDPASAR